MRIDSFHHSVAAQLTIIRERADRKRNVAKLTFMTQTVGRATHLGVFPVTFVSGIQREIFSLHWISEVVKDRSFCPPKTTNCPAGYEPAPNPTICNPFSIWLLDIVYHVSPPLATAKATVRLTQVAFTTFA